MIGKDIKPHDKTLIEHELLEMKIKEENPTMEHWKAHEMAAKAYDYPKEADEYYGNLKNITKTKNNISADYYPEGRSEKRVHVNESEK